MGGLAGWVMELRNLKVEEAANGDSNGVSANHQKVISKLKIVKPPKPSHQPQLKKLNLGDKRAGLDELG